ncbi:oxidoreductase (plasmid) [Sphingobium sp. LB126]|uniref:SDR family NAD(P)-dependent oxidoreductase n=1 Tax=Sphingobium sp. LB126 TaxID=1983755 RepID=UPI000C20DDD4|nr:SDR family NAD(P)-dependent oxidoreductase [Sphingobium sp. LB126]PJG45062.1 oxidoreductase [Sphingobium sp. LB126]
MSRLADKVAIITGIGSGMGRAAAKLFAAQGAQVVGCDISEASCGAVVADIRNAGGEISALAPCNPVAPDQAERLVRFALDQYGGIDVVYNNAAEVEMAWIEHMTSDMWATTMRGELDIVFNLVKAAWPHLKARGGGSIINCGSISGKVGIKVLPAIGHATGKGGVIAMTRQIAVEGGPHKIRANSISPGLVRTGATIDLMKSPEWLAAMSAKLLLDGQVGEPEDIAYCALFLASDESGWVTGADFAIDGGASAC